MRTGQKGKTPGFFQKSNQNLSQMRSFQLISVFKSKNQWNNRSITKSSWFHERMTEACCLTRSGNAKLNFSIMTKKVSQDIALVNQDGQNHWAKTSVSGEQAERERWLTGRLSQLKVEYHLHGERTLHCNNPGQAPQSVCSCERYKDNDLPWRRNLATGKSV